MGDSSLYSAIFLLASLSTVAVHVPKTELRLEVARTPVQRENGLMNRTNVPAHTGMIFVFDGDGPVAFWMKNTRVPLDMIFIGADGSVRRVFSNVPVVDSNMPDDLIPRESAQAKFVIELAAGEAAKDGIVAGLRIDLRGVPLAQ